MMRYSRQQGLMQIGEAGQQKLMAATVAVIGAGGLGSPVLTYLAAAGVGNLRLIEADTVSESNLNRQFLYGVADLGKSKGEVAAAKLAALNPQVTVTWENARLEASNAAQLLRGCEVVVDCVDNLATRLLVGDACLAAGIPLVEGGIDGFYGYLTVVSASGTCLRCLGMDEHTQAPKETASLGVTAGVIGSLMANQCLKLLLGIETCLVSKLMNYDGLRDEWETVDVRQDPRCPAPHTTT